jgi:hypothetical protein
MCGLDPADVLMVEDDPEPASAYRMSGGCPAGPGSALKRLGGVDGSGEVENSLRQLAGGFHGCVVAHAVE